MRMGQRIFLFLAAFGAVTCSDQSTYIPRACDCRENVVLSEQPARLPSSGSGCHVELAIAKVTIAALRSENAGLRLIVERLCKENPTRAPRRAHKLAHDAGRKALRHRPVPRTGPAIEIYATCVGAGCSEATGAAVTNRSDPSCCSATDRSSP
jgi:hypothetical protein